ncbi:hypothetical protein [Taibaiella soli]|uniref:Carboxypeptidase-like regulatory domain-containing protein n=1 Tax=Taibaiella soli TaxID=1649169 RepID=A0A2W2APS9_9BACT|nr:hypothetical protein [Taibaiella soli]PZF74410.1 hypothetical protein DN068_02190 [Taibaiella soli]
MKRQTNFRLSVPEPCTQDWDAMTPDAKGHFCAHCQKSVIDFTTWSDADLYAFLSKNIQSVCGRFQADQLNRAIQLPTQKPTRLYRIAIALGLGLIFTQLSTTHARPKPPLMEQNVFTQQNDTTGIDSFIIKGTVLDATKQPAINAVVNVKQYDKIIGNNVTDIDGNFEILFPHISDTTNILLQVQYMGHLPVTVPFDQSKTKLSISLEMGKRPIMGVFYMRPLVNNQHPGPNSTFTREQIKNMPY